MLSLLPIVLALASTDPSPAPSASARPTPLTEIGHVRALPICTPIVVHANSAITTTLDNDRQLSIVTLNLRNVDYERLNSMQLRNALDAMMKQASAIRIQSGNADGEIKKLREYAAVSQDPNRKAELKAFADAIGGAIYRQKKMAVELMRDLTIVQGRQEAAQARAIQDRSMLPSENGGPTMLSHHSLQSQEPVQYNEALRNIADALDEHTQAILGDEGIAADHSIGATSGC